MVAIFDIIKNTQGWQFHTHMDIIMGVSNMNAQYIQTASNKPMSTRYPRILIIIANGNQKVNIFQIWQLYWILKQSNTIKE